SQEIIPSICGNPELPAANSLAAGLLDLPLKSRGEASHPNPEWRVQFGPMFPLLAVAYSIALRLEQKTSAPPSYCRRRGYDNAIGLCP
ncbi:hypothetical protein, partial [Mesorhizobium sp. M4B.F.Ca.ET.169.01.1.1]|uniref:hypothetical protein n=1 Tax=Mesorhizobium sp. M4B.F.Ca.ET.169.01.1.1 TaxID=2563949 RepID=UPI001675EBF5